MSRMIEALLVLGKDDLLHLAIERLKDEDVRRSWRKLEIVEELARYSVDDLLEALRRDELGWILDGLGLESGGRKQARSERLKEYLTAFSTEDVATLLQKLRKTDLLQLAASLEDSDISNSWTKHEITSELAEHYELDAILEHATSEMLNRIGVPSDDDEEEEDEDETWAGFLADGAASLLRKLRKVDLLQLATSLEDPDISSSWTKEQILSELVSYYEFSFILEHATPEMLIRLGITEDPDDPQDDDAEEQRSSAVQDGHRAKCLIIGNSDYRDDPLSNPRRDAVAMSRLLESLGHEVVEVLLDATKAEITKGIRKLAKAVGSNDGALVYFSGHGLTHEGRNWVLPVNFNAEDEDDIEDEAWAADGFLKRLKQAKFRVVILDACRNNGFTRQLTKGGGAGGLRMINLRSDVNSFIWFATAPGYVAFDGEPGTYGWFTEALLANLNAPGCSLEEIDRRVRKQVYENSKGKQIPWSNTSFLEPWLPAGS